jgi:hypothetical protein
MVGPGVVVDEDVEVVIVLDDVGGGIELVLRVLGGNDEDEEVVGSVITTREVVRVEVGGGRVLDVELVV